MWNARCLRYYTVLSREGSVTVAPREAQGTHWALSILLQGKWEFKKYGAKPGGRLREVSEDEKEGH